MNTNNTIPQPSPDKPREFAAAPSPGPAPTSPLPADAVTSQASANAGATDTTNTGIGANPPPKARPNTLLGDYLSRIALGEPQRFENLAILPVFTPVEPAPDYLTLTEALQRSLVNITEVTSEGQVPFLKVTNSADVPVLLLEGEELIGARQNRVLNTSILVKEHSDLIIPVSCTEAGRWGYNSDKFSHSGHLTSNKLRKIKSSSVAAALKESPGHYSDQSAVWAEIKLQSLKAHVTSPTHALLDVYEAKKNRLNSFLEQFKPDSNQNGLVVLLNGELAGMDVVSSKRAYQTVHDKIIRSYALDALLEETGVGTESSREKAMAFFEEANACVERPFPVVGCGLDYRFESPRVQGAALVADGKVIHLNLYRN